MAVRASFENNHEIGCFAKLTNCYCLVAIGDALCQRWANHGLWPHPACRTFLPGP
uniref:Eukaryotic translation initiation factor 6 n=1 Tax=Chrysemys picta bellii TaxID=8478 RepID=A0A8C3F8H6_CHRPI